MKLSVSKTEILHISISVLTIALAFSLFPAGDFTVDKFLLVLLTVGLGFILHELGHKYTAMKYGAQAEFRAWTEGLFFALAVAWVSNGAFIFAAPGAVYVYGKAVSKEENGKIALAGPMVNIALSIGFIILGATTPELSELAHVGENVNAFLAFFNLIPFGPLDGAKVRAWSNTAWLTAIALSAVLLVF